MLVYDVEVLRGPDETPGKWGNPEGMGFGTAVVYDTATNRYHLFGPSKQAELVDMLSKGYPTVLSFNGLKFDNAVILGNVEAEAQLASPSHWTDIDLLLEAVNAKFPRAGDSRFKSVNEAAKTVGFCSVFNGSLSLDSICKATIGRGKTGSGAFAPELIKAEKWDEVFDYNMEDVHLTYDLWRFWKAFGYMIDGQGNVLKRKAS